MPKRNSVVEFITILGIALTAMGGALLVISGPKPHQCSIRKPCNVTLWGKPVANTSPREFDAVKTLPNALRVPIKGHD